MDIQSTDIKSVIEIENLGFSWKPCDEHLLHIATLQVMQGERVFLRGPSGSGKSTLLSLLAGVSQVQSGSLKVLGQDLGSMSSVQRDHFRSDHVGFIFQMFNLIPYLSIVENVTLPCRFSGHKFQNTAEQGGGPRRP